MKNGEFSGQQGIWHSKTFGVPIRTPIQKSPEFWSFHSNWRGNSKSLHTPIQNRLEFWSGKLPGTEVVFDRREIGASNNTLSLPCSLHRLSLHFNCGTQCVTDKCCGCSHSVEQLTCRGFEYVKVEMRVTQSVSGTKCLQRARSLGWQSSRPAGWMAHCRVLGSVYFTSVLDVQ